MGHFIPHSFCRSRLPIILSFSIVMIRSLKTFVFKYLLDIFVFSPCDEKFRQPRGRTIWFFSSLIVTPKKFKWFDYYIVGRHPDQCSLHDISCFKCTNVVNWFLTRKLIIVEFTGHPRTGNIRRNIG